MASKMGSSTVANCASCHGVHNILPSSDPQVDHQSRQPGQDLRAMPSRREREIHQPARSISTARKADFGSKLIALISKFYIWMIVAVIGGMVLHNLIVFRKKLILHRIGQPRILFRMTLAQRVQHLTLLTSFFTLVLTGFALRYPTSWLAMIFVNELVRSYIHRIAGVVLIAVSLFHIWYVIARTRKAGS